MVTTDQAATDIKIDDQAFYNNQLTQLSLADQVSQIGASAFSHNQLTKVTLPQGLIQLGDEAFSDNHLTQVTLPRLDALTSGTTIFTRQTNVIDANTLTKSNQLALTDLIQLTSDSTKATYAQVTSITDGVTYNQETGMFTIPEGTTEFDFRLAKLAFDPNDSLYISGNYTADLDGVDVPETENPDTGAGAVVNLIPASQKGEQTLIRIPLARLRRFLRLQQKLIPAHRHQLTSILTWYMQNVVYISTRVLPLPQRIVLRHTQRRPGPKHRPLKFSVQRVRPTACFDTKLRAATSPQIKIMWQASIMH
nr:leucine-rich repeat domain-containing protein [Secundilactobacillus collinoides]